MAISFLRNNYCRVNFARHVYGQDVSHKAMHVSCKQWLGGTVPKVSKTSNSNTLLLGHFPLKVSLENTNVKFLPSVVLTIRNSNCLLNELRQLQYFRRGTEISKYRLKTVEHLRNTRELTVAPVQLDKTGTDCVRKNLKNVISTYFQVFSFFFPRYVTG